MDKSRFIICRAAAGSGKTYALVKQYLQLALDGDEYSLPTRFARILAVTFTNKAANEMKERIVRELDGIAANGSGTPMGKDLSESMGLDGETLQHRATVVRRGILHNYSDFAVYTIDSFVHGIVRTFAHDLNLPPNFDIYLDREELSQKAVDLLMGLAGSDGHGALTKILCNYAESRMEEGKGYMVESNLMELARELFNEDTPQYLQALGKIDIEQYDTMRHKMTAQNKAYENRMKELGREGLEIIHGAGLAVEDFYYGSKGAGAYFDQLAAGSMKKPNSYALAYLEGDKLGGGKCSNETKAMLQEVKPRLQEVQQRIEELCKEGERLYYSRQMAMKGLYALALMNKMNEMVENYSRENEVLHISEFNKRIAEVVQNEPSPFIYERIGNRYYNYLIDEFQDTSTMQWQNLVPLVENGVGSGHTSLVVGDGKQAIYRFRQGDVKQFVRLPRVDNKIHGRLLESPGVASLTRLEHNYRSGRVIVDFNNDFFEWAIRSRFDDNQDLNDIYIGGGDSADLRQTAVKEGGYVQLHTMPKECDHEEIWKEMAADIENLRDEKGYHYGDMAVLARNNSTLAEISTYLVGMGIPVVSGESFLLSQSRVVMMMTSLMHYVMDGNDRVAAAQVIQYMHSLGLMENLDDRMVEMEKRSIDLDKVMQEHGLELDSTRLRNMNLYDCCEEALRMLHLGGIETAYVSTWLGVVNRYANRHRDDMGEFLEWFEEQKDRLSTNTASELDAVRLMTIHKAKGLESPIVLYAIVNHREQTDDIWVNIDPDSGLPLPVARVHAVKGQPSLFDEEFDEERGKSDMDRMNVLYVAMTRPKEKLLIYCQEPKSDDAADYASLLGEYMQQRNDAYEINENILAIGENSPARKIGDGKEAMQGIDLANASFPSWTSRITIASQSEQIFWQLDEEYLRLGNHMHGVLALIRHIGESEKALSTYSHRNHLDEGETAKLQHMLNNMMQQTEVARFFDPINPCRNECDIAWEGEVLRPDRIVYTKQGVLVVDFKTGQSREEHRSQVLHYCEAMRKMGHTTVQGYLLYIEEERCRVVAV